MVNPLWPDPATLPKLFTGEAPTAMPPFAQDLAGGMDLVKKFWSLPGGTALPGFLVPTVDVAELDKRLSDLRAAESWVEVNLNMLRATIQGLEVQRNTIATIQSLSTMAEGAMAGAPSSPAVPPGGLPPGWPMTSSSPSPFPPAPSPIAPSPITPQAVPVDPPATTATESGGSPAAEAPTATTPVDPVLGLAANNWLGFLQQQFMKVAQAAIAPVEPGDAAPAKVAAKKSTTRSATRSATASVAKRTKRRAPIAR